MNAYKVDVVVVPFPYLCLKCLVQLQMDYRIALAGLVLVARSE
jgi:hypothetical protein